MKRLRSADSRVTLPVTPMLDMTFQLLFFFIVCFNPADQEGHLDLALAAEKDFRLVDPAPVPMPGEAAFPSEVTVTVRSTRQGAEGHISALTVSAGPGVPVAIDGGLAGLRKHLAALRPKQPDGDAVKIQSDGQLKTRHLLEVMDVCKAAGFSKVGLAPAEG